MSDKKNDENDEENNDLPILTDEETENLDLKSEKTKKLMKQYEKETSRHAIWRDNITESFKKWLKGERTIKNEFLSMFQKKYDKERISLYVSKEINSVPPFNPYPMPDAKFVKLKDESKTDSSQYDILLIEDDLATIRLLTSYFETKGYSCHGVLSGSKGLQELSRTSPKVILLDIILPDLSGYDIYKVIKSDKQYKEIPIFFLTASSGSEVKNYTNENIILKPFNFSDFEVILNILKGFKPEKQ